MSQHQFIANKALAMLACKCPQCQSGNMFMHKATKLNGFSKMHQNCEHCGLTFEIEPGFFWGAMYVSYALTTGLMLITCGSLLWIFNDPDFWVYLVSIVAVVFITLPWVFRYSRMLMLYLFSPIKFNTNLANR